MFTRQRSGVILLVVLSSLTFFSLLVVSYFVFASQSRVSAFTSNASKTRAPDIRGLMDEAMLTLLRGTNDVSNPFYGESIFSDLMGRDGAEMKVADVAITDLRNGFVRFSAQTTAGARLESEPFDDIYSGRIITFRNGPLRNQSFRVVRSRAGSTSDDFFIEISPEQIREFGTSPTIATADVRELFHENVTSPADGYLFRLNGTPRSSPGVGFNGTNLEQTVSTAGLAEELTSGTLIGFDLPVALQPNFIRHPSFSTTSGLDKSITTGDFDEGHDAADYNNWFLSHRNPDGTVIPSFHRPSVINYILNEPLTSDADVYYRNLVASLARATMRPLPIAEGQFGASSSALNTQFTGGNENFALRVPLLLQGSGAPRRLHLLAQALIESFDVDNDGDGRPDSVWINPGLPLITSPEGKLLRPMIAPMIEDMSARLNLNTSGNQTQAPETAGVSANAFWGTGTPFANSVQPAFRGLGYGPAEVVIPSANNTDQIAEINALLTARYGSDGVPGIAGEDPLDILRTGFRPTAHGLTGTQGGFGFSTDPYGRLAVGIGRDGQLVMGSDVAADEKVNDPYEFDPTGKLVGDNPFTFAQLEAVLRANDFDTELLPQEVREDLEKVIAARPALARAITTSSVSADAPEWTLLQFVERMNQLGATADQALVNDLIAPEFRLGHRLDVNRPFGNQIDSDSDGIVDEPSESEMNTYATGSPYQEPPDYNFDFDNATGPTARELLARHLYVLMMMVTSDNYQFPNVDPADTDVYRARRLAQWAVNVVDYRDPDSIMTRFAFDPLPFDGWSPPVDTTTGLVLKQNVVWGVEAPDILLRESLCFHDVRLSDTENDDGEGKKLEPPAGNGPPPPGPFDDDSDQVRVPQGSTFIELQCVHPVDNGDTSQKAGFLKDIYTNSNRIDLAATTTNGVPVWRLAFSEPHDASTAKAAVSPLSLRTSEPIHGSFAPENKQSREIDAELADPLDLQRFVWFTDFADQNAVGTLITNVGITDMNQDEVFFASGALNPQKNLQPGQFLVVAPRTITHMGSKPTADPFPFQPSAHRFARNGSSLFLHDRSGTQLTPDLGAAAGAYSNALTLYVGAEVPADWPRAAFQDGHVGLNISEPLRNAYYPLPGDTDADGDPNFRSYTGGQDGDMDGAADYPLEDAYLDRANPSISQAVDRPQDPVVDILPSLGREPKLGTIENFRTVYLQRIADPTSNYNADTNPYRTIDWMSLDLTVFSGEEDAALIDNSGQYARRSIQRTGGNNSENMLYSYKTNFDADAADDGPDALGGGADFFAPTDGYFRNSLGFLNTQEAAVNPGFQGYTASIGMTLTNHDRNLPNTPYALHPWLNRPFATHLELMMVPASSQTRLLEDFSIVTTADPDIYPKDGSDAAIFRGPFGHLLNFFHSSDESGDSTKSPEYARFFDFVHTLPRFKGEVDVIEPDRVEGGTGDQQFLNDLLGAPFNLKYDNHRNGRINLNTLAEFPAWAGLMQGHMNTGEFTDDHLTQDNTLRNRIVTDSGDTNQLSYNNMLRNRRGYDRGTLSTVLTGSQGDYNYDPANLHPDYPTQFAGAYKHALDAPYAPQTRTNAQDSTDAMRAPKRLRLREVNSTLLRTNGPVDTDDMVSTAGVRNTPAAVSQFVRANAQTPSQTGADEHQNRQKNPFIRYQTLMRMPNLVSDNSQLFLMRMTLGFFEVDASNVNSLGREYNADRGENKRYQATFLIDRSKPVGFAPGENLNIRDAVIFESYAQ